jgi:hypothetical protein
VIDTPNRAGMPSQASKMVPARSERVKLMKRPFSRDAIALTSMPAISRPSPLTIERRRIR